MATGCICRSWRAWAPSSGSVARARGRRSAAPARGRLVVGRVALLDALDLQEERAVAVPPRGDDRALGRREAPALAVSLDLDVEDDGVALGDGRGRRGGRGEAVELRDDRIADGLRHGRVARAGPDADGVRAARAAMVHVRDHRAAGDERGEQDAAERSSEQRDGAVRGVHRQEHATRTSGGAIRCIPDGSPGSTRSRPTILPR